MRKKMILYGCLILLFLSSSPANACTLWAATGSRVEGGGTLIAKNRDWVPDHIQELRLIEPKDGFRYYGIFAQGGNAPGLKGGINERGLVVITASASSIPRQQRLSEAHTKGLLSLLLKTCDSVDAALAKNNLFVGAEYIMLADRTKTAVIEMAPGGHYAVHEVNDGIVWHTNHYIEPALQSYNMSIGESSVTRYDRIEELLNSRATPYSLSDFITFSGDRKDGPDNSIWRSGSTPKKTRTLSSCIVYLPSEGSPVLRVKLANPGDDEEIVNVRLDEVFK